MPGQEHQRELDDLGHPVRRLLGPRERGDDVADRREGQRAEDDEARDERPVADDLDTQDHDADPDDDRSLRGRDEQAHDDVRPDQGPAWQGRRVESLEDELLALLDERDRGEDAELHERHGEDARHEERDAVEPARLQRLGFDRQDRRRARELEVRGHHQARRDLLDRLGRARPAGVGDDRDRDRAACLPHPAPPRSPQRRPSGITRIPSRSPADMRSRDSSSVPSVSSTGAFATNASRSIAAGGVPSSSTQPRL